MFADTDLDVADLDAPDPDHLTALSDDLDLATLVDAMAAGDDLVARVSRRVLLHPLATPHRIVYRQEVLADCLREPATVRALYELTGRAVAAQGRNSRGTLSEGPETVLARAVQMLVAFTDALGGLRSLAHRHGAAMRSPAFTAFFDAVHEELTDDYLAHLAELLRQLQLRDGATFSARQGDGGRSGDLVLRHTRRAARSLLDRFGRAGSAQSYTVADDDHVAQIALSQLRSRALNDVAAHAAHAAQDVARFFHVLRAELAFYLGCLNLRDTLAGAGSPMCVPVLGPAGAPVLRTRELYDVCLRLRTLRGGPPVVANTVTGDGMSLIIVTGANQGGKTTFLRSLGLAQLMSGAGMFAAAQELMITARSCVATHFPRAEDTAMASGRLDEELERMSRLADVLTDGALLLCNESFQSTNEREGSELAAQIIDGLTAAGVTVVFVTHLFDLAADRFARRELAPALFLRAERDADGSRPYRLVVAGPLPTSYGRDIYERIIAGPPGVC